MELAQNKGEDYYCSQCKKCLYEAHEVHYCDNVNSGFISLLCIKQIVGHEHLHVTCKRCGYEYLMKCADNK